MLETFNPTTLNNFRKDDTFENLDIASLLSYGNIPQSHKKIADNYMVIKKIYGFQTINSKISVYEKNLLKQYDFDTLENTTINKMNEEIELLKRWSNSKNKKLQLDADVILQIRVKELKFLMGYKYTLVSNELSRGYLALEKYLETVSKYRNNI
ncbi:MAG: hypothetical protein MRZ90_00935 [Candidatus Gastranaerophilales bacterium]|nr:hypothetical protein [Candidatus Gastranaerophilales bacterium]